MQAFLKPRDQSDIHALTGYGGADVKLVGNGSYPPDDLAVLADGCYEVHIRNMHAGYGHIIAAIVVSLFKSGVIFITVLEQPLDEHAHYPDVCHEACGKYHRVPFRGEKSVTQLPLLSGHHR